MDPKRRNFLLVNLAIIAIFILTLVLLVAQYPNLLALAPSPSPTTTLTPTASATFTITPTITPTPTVTFTPRASFTPTPTLTPTPTQPPTGTPTPTGPPTLTPAVPADLARYGLHTWTPDDAERAIGQMEYYPYTLPFETQQNDPAAFFAAFDYAVVAYQEALLRFPDAPQARQWRWNLAYNLARSGNAQAGEAYSGLILRALNAGETRPEDLRNWFQASEQRMALGVVKLEPPSGYLSSYLVEVRGNGAAYVWLRETPGAYEADVLISHFDFAQDPHPASILSDLNADGMEDLAIVAGATGESLIAFPPRVFNLASVPAQEMPFRPDQAQFQVGIEFENHWIIRRNARGQNDLTFSIRTFPACPVEITRAYRWNGQVFALEENRYETDPARESLSFCRYLVDHAINLWGAEAAAQIMQGVQPLWPPDVDEDGQPFPRDARDAWRFQMGVYQALAGHFEDARRTLAEITTLPSLATSAWIEPARRFLETYQTPEDLYRACLDTEICRPALAVKQMVAGLPEGSTAGEAYLFLQEHGLAPRASGYFDFDLDEQTERWFTVRYRPLEKLELWVLADSPAGAQALRVGEVESNTPTLTYLDENQAPPVVWTDETALIMDREPVSQMAYLTFVPRTYQWRNRYLEGLLAARSALFAGEDPKEVSRQFELLQTVPGLLCRGTWTCDPYYYLLGLSNELAGEKRDAIQAYYKLWTDYSKSPYTTLARLKLAGEGLQPSATPAQSSTPTARPTVTGTPPTPTPSPTITVTGTPPTPTPSPTVTLTVTPGTPYP